MDANGRKDVQAPNGSPAWMNMFIAAALIALLGVSGGVLAADPAQRQPGTASNQMDQLARATALIGKDVTVAENKKVGEIKDLAIDMQNSRIGYVVIGRGGVLGIGEKLVAVPPQAIAWARDDRAVALQLPAEQLERAPALKGDNWISEIGPTEVSDIYRQSGMTAPDDLQAGKAYRKGTDILGRSVLSNRDEHGFEVKDIAVNLQEGRAPYVVLSAGGFAGINTKLIAVPTPGLSPGHEDFLRVNATGQQLTSAPSLDAERWETTLADRAWGADLYLSYGLTPYWTGDAGSTPRATGGTQPPAGETLEQQGN